jgi:hypothetical protein
MDPADKNDVRERNVQLVCKGLGDALQAFNAGRLAEARRHAMLAVEYIMLLEYEAAMPPKAHTAERPM